MKKQLLIGAFMLASVFTTQAQELLYGQDFEDINEVFPQDPEAPSWGSLDLDGDQAAFFNFSPNATFTQMGFTGAVMGSGNFVTDNQGNVLSQSPDTDNVLLSVGLQLPNADTNVSFKIAGIALEPGATSPYEIYIIGNAERTALNAATTAAEFTAALDALTPATSGNATNTATTLTLSLSDFKEQAVEILFRHRNEELANYLLMDDFELKSGVAGVNENLITKLSVFPNPANDVVNVTNNENILIDGVQVVDLNGRTVKTAKFNGVTNAQINVSDLASGVYMMTVSSDKGTMTKKIVKN